MSVEAPLIIGSYALHAQIASGGMGVVYFATTDGDRSNGRAVVAAKRLHPHLRHDQTFAMMLLDEARLAVSVRHPNVVQVIDVLSTPDDLLLVLEYVAGLSVHELATHGNAARKRSPVPLPVAITIVVDGLRGLQAAHEAVGEDGKPLDLIHRDVSPQNLLVDATGVTKLTDFGVAKAVGRLRSTRDGSIRGKVAYMSPEQVADSAVDQRADIYSFAVVLWELLAGRAMFVAESDVALFGKAMRGATERLSAVVPDIPPAIDAAIWRALARDPRRRYPTARAFADALVDAFGAVDHGWVAQWMKERAGTLLVQRQSTVKQLLSRDRAMLDRAMLEDANTITTTGVMSEPMTIDPPQMTTATLAPLPLPPPASTRSRAATALLGLLAAGATIAVVVFATSMRAAPVSASVPALPLAEPEPTATPTATPSSTASVVLVPPPPASVVPAGAVTSAKRPRPAAPKRALEKDPKADCNPPYSEDETGKHFKPWCLRP